MRQHYHVVQFIDGSLNDGDSGPYTTLKDARAELRDVVQSYRQRGQTVKAEGKDRYVCGLYIIKIEACENTLQECEAVQ
jgi:t-SNARE complex subunit (syntaxin)